MCQYLPAWIHKDVVLVVAKPFLSIVHLFSSSMIESFLVEAVTMFSCTPIQLAFSWAIENWMMSHRYHRSEQRPCPFCTRQPLPFVPWLRSPHLQDLQWVHVSAFITLQFRNLERWLATCALALFREGSPPKSATIFIVQSPTSIVSWLRNLGGVQQWQEPSGPCATSGWC